MKQLLRVFLAIALLAGISFGLFMMVQFRENATADKAAYRELEKFSKVLQYIEANYVEEINPTKVVEGAIQGMLSSLDPHSAYLDPEVYREMKTETSGKFGGLGIEVSTVDGYLTVVSPIDETPAQRAGIKAGDRILKINGQSTKLLGVPAAVQMMRGKVGEPVKLQIGRAGEPPMDLTLTRESIRMQSVRWARVEGDIGYVRVSSFMETTSEEVARALDKLLAAPAVKGFVLDLRGNPGGLLDQAVRLSNLFIDEGPVVYTIGRDRTKKEVEHAQKGRMKTDLPLVVLIDAGSASASEIVAGCLQDYRRAVIAGVKSFGKGSVQTIVPLGDTAGLKLTIARYYTPSGRSIQAKGIEPDVPLEVIDPKAVEEALARSKRRLVSEADLEGHFDNEDGADAEEAPLPSVSPSPLPSVAVKGPLPKSLEERLKSDYMVLQASRILKTMAVTRAGLAKPEFKE